MLTVKYRSFMKMLRADPGYDPPKHRLTFVERLPSRERLGRDRHDAINEKKTS